MADDNFHRSLGMDKKDPGRRRRAHRIDKKNKYIPHWRENDGWPMEKSIIINNKSKNNDTNKISRNLFKTKNIHLTLTFVLEFSLSCDHKHRQKERRKKKERRQEKIETIYEGSLVNILIYIC